jgi:hypothetical protein
LWRRIDLGKMAWQCQGKSMEGVEAVHSSVAVNILTLPNSRASFFEEEEEACLFESPNDLGNTALGQDFCHS